MKRAADFVIKYRHVFTGVFLALVIACAAMIPFVETNYDMTKYLDGSAPSVVSLDKMEEQFGSVGTAQLMVKNVSESEARAIQTDILGVPGVSAVAFDAADESSYKDGNALYKIFLETGNYEVETDAVIDGIRAVLAERDIAMNGGAVQSQYLRTGVSGDMLIILAVALVIVFGILLLTSIRGQTCCCSPWWWRARSSSIWARTCFWAKFPSLRNPSARSCSSRSRWIIPSSCCIGSTRRWARG